MKEVITESRTRVQRTLATGGQEEDNDHEMHECLARLKVWQIENLMAPKGMDRFYRAAVRSSSPFEKEAQK